MKLAIVIPFYKIAFFAETLQSLANQTDKRFKVYIGDDGSLEHPTDLLEKYKDQFDFIYHEFEKNLGGISLTKQWQRCIELSGDEEWIMILGDDDRLSINSVECFYLYLPEIEENKINVIRYSTVVIDQNNKEISQIHTHPKYEKSIDFLMRKFKGGTRSSLSEYVFRKSALVHIRFKDLPLAWYADLLAVVEVSEFDLIFTINEAVVDFRLSGLNITSRNDNLLQKNLASFHFYYYLLKNKMSFLNREQRVFLLMKLEKTFLDNKMNINFWIFFTKLYVSNGYFIRYFAFLNTILKEIYKKINK